MTTQKRYIEDFKKYTKSINSSKENAIAFYQRAGILTPTGRLKKAYSYTNVKSSKSKKVVSS